MSEIQQAKDRCFEIEVQVTALKEELGCLRKKIARSKTSLREGDKVKIAGKDKVWQLTRIGYGYGNDPDPKFFGGLLKKNGEPSTREQEIYVWYGESLEKVTA